MNCKGNVASTRGVYDELLMACWLKLYFSFGTYNNRKQEVCATIYVVVNHLSQ
jgi:hypothetical protein